MSTMTMEIVPFSALWLDATAALEDQAGDVRWSKAQFAQELALPMSRFFVLLDGERLAGYGGYWKVDSEAQITNLVVDPDRRGRGLGERLLRFLLESARSEACRRGTLEVRASNLPAQRLYEKAGFQKSGRRPGVYEHPREAAVLMEKVL